MSDEMNGRGRLSGRVGQLVALVELGAGPAPLRPPLEVAGDVLRRGRAAEELRPGAAELVERALRSVQPAALEGWWSSLSLEQVASRIARAAEEAVEAGLSEGAEDGDAWASFALQGLLARDAVESARVALARLAPQSPSARSVLDRLSAALSEQDRALREKARWLVALNHARREERDLLDPEHRAAAWWFSARADCDGLLAAMAGEAPASPHLDSCAECRRDLEVARPVEQRRGRHLGPEDLWRLDLGAATPAERAIAKRHAARCRGCAELLRALDEGERAIADLDEPPAGPTSAAVAAPPKAARRRQPVDEERDFRVHVRRRRSRVGLVISQVRPGRLLAAVLVPGRPRSPEGRETADGLEFDLGDASALEGVTVRVQVTISGVEHEREIEL